MIFRLSIHLGNDAMQTPDDIARALRHVAESVADTLPHDVPAIPALCKGIIRDLNGNKVGQYRLEPEHALDEV